MHRTRQAKIVATLGPASADRQTIEALFKQAADLFQRLVTTASSTSPSRSTACQTLRRSPLIFRNNPSTPQARFL